MSEDIINSNGGGLRKVTQHTKRKQSGKDKMEIYKAELIKKFYEKGWKFGFLKKHIVEPQLGLWYEDGYRLEEIATQWVDRSKANSHNDFVNCLRDFGLRKAFVNQMNYVLLPMEESYSYDQLLLVMIDLLLTNRYKPICPQNQLLRFPEIEPFTLFPVATKFHSRSGTQLSDKSQINSAICKIANNHGIAKTKHTLMYHATSWAAADSIMRRGILNFKGRECLDFGLNPSFYMTPQIETALEWSDKIYRGVSSETCILVFSFIKPSNLTYKGFQEPTDEWCRLVGLSRLCKESAANTLDEYDFVYGPMVSNVKECTDGKKARTHSPIKYQLASKSEDSSKYIGKQCLIGVVWLPKK